MVDERDMIAGGCVKVFMGKQGNRDTSETC